MKKLRSILLVDDDPIVIFINTNLINTLGLTDIILTAQNGQDAIALLEKLKQSYTTASYQWPELILLDISMPVMNGFEFMAEFEALNLPDKPKVILLTNSMHPNDQIKARQFTLTDHLHKPLTIETLSSAIEKHFEEQL